MQVRLSRAFKTCAAAILLAALPPMLHAENVSLDSKGVLGGKWSQKGESIIQSTSNEAVAIQLAKGEPQFAYRVEVEVKLDKTALGSGGGLVLQFEGEENYLTYILQQRTGGPFAVLEIKNDAAQKRFDGTAQVETVFVGDQSRHEDLDLKAWHRLRADVRGAEVICYLNGQQAATYWFQGTPPPYDHFGVIWPDDPDEGLVGLTTRNSKAEFRNFTITELPADAEIITPTRGRRDAEGNLLAQQSLGETMVRLNEWMIRSDEVLDKSSAPKALHKMPPYLMTNWLTVDDKPWMLGGEYGFNHSITLMGAVDYYYYSADKRILEVAQTIADWHIANLTGPKVKVPNLVQSVVNWKEDGTWDELEWGLELDKSAYMGRALLKLGAITGEQKYIDAAKRIAETLRKYQQEDGSWLFRVVPKTGEVKQAYSSSQLWYVWFFEELANVTGNEEDRERSRKAETWLLENPMKDNRWWGLYGDVMVGAESYDQWIPCEMGMHLIANRTRIPGAVQKAEDLLHFLKRELISDYGFHHDVPGLLEQGTFSVSESIQQFRIAELYAALYTATRREDYKREAIAAANSTTYCQMSDGKMRQGLWFLAIDSPMVLSYNYQICRLMAWIPELAPKGENHLLATTRDLTRIEYKDKAIEFSTQEGLNEQTLSVTGKPSAVEADGVALRPIEIWGLQEIGWHYDEEHNQLKIRHRAKDVAVRF